MTKKPFISLRNINKTFDHTHIVIDNLSLDIQEGSFVTILGPSGCGKSTLLKLIGGFELPTKGQILLNGLDIKDMPIYQRPTATVFQDYALFPNMSVYENVAYGIKKMRTHDDSKTKVDAKIETIKKEAILKASEKLKINAQKIIKTKQKIEKETNALKQIQNPKCFFYKTKSKMINALDDQLNDLDYWKSYWQSYSFLCEQKAIKNLTTRKFNKTEIKQKVYEVIKLVGLQGNEDKMPDELSGGMKQRVALARAIITLPKVLLLDEPLSALDAKVRQQMQIELKQIHKKLGITFILVTHDQEEALTLSDKVVVMSSGKIEQEGTSSDIYDSPINVWVSQFIGKANLIEGTYVSLGKVKIYDKLIETSVIEGFAANQKVRIMIRPEDFDVVAPSKGLLDVYVESASYLGKFWELKCKYNDKTIYVENIDQIKAGQTIGLLWDAIDVHVMKY